MTEDEFTALSTFDKWSHIKKTMDYIVQMDHHYGLRTRLNPHHAKEQQKQEQRNLRTDQYQRWGHIKNLYGANRDELVNTLELPDFENCKNILERIFTMEVDDALRDIMDE
jgi:exonuclease VII large subunit